MDKKEHRNKIPFKIFNGGLIMKKVFIFLFVALFGLSNTFLVQAMKKQRPFDLRITVEGRIFKWVDGTDHQRGFSVEESGVTEEYVRMMNSLEKNLNDKLKEGSAERVISYLQSCFSISIKSERTRVDFEEKLSTLFREYFKNDKQQLETLVKKIKDICYENFCDAPQRRIFMVLSGWCETFLQEGTFSTPIFPFGQDGNEASDGDHMMQESPADSRDPSFAFVPIKESKARRFFKKIRKLFCCSEGNCF